MTRRKEGEVGLASLPETPPSHTHGTEGWDGSGRDDDPDRLRVQNYRRSATPPKKPAGSSCHRQGGSSDVIILAPPRREYAAKQGPTRATSPRRPHG